MTLRNYAGHGWDKEALEGFMNLPLDPDNMNDDRAGWAEEALKTFMTFTRTDPEDSLADLLTDLMHWADRNEPNFAAELERARGNYESETTEET